LLIPLAFALSGCPDPLEPPVAVISAGPEEARGDAGTCAAVHSVTTVVGEAPQIHANCSHDPADLSLSYHWMLVDLPNNSLAELHNEQASSPGLFPDVPGHYRLSLIVSNGTLTSRSHVDVQAEPRDDTP
jgi:hypothetical protein